MQLQVQAQVASLSDEDKMLFKIYASESQGPKMGIPEIRINYDEEKGALGNFLVIDYDDEDELGNPKRKVTLVDNEIEVTIMRTRFKYGYFDQDAGEKGMEVYGTPEMDDYKGEVSLWDNQERKVIFTGQYKAFKSFIQTTFPDARLAEKGYKGSIIKHTEILYVEYKSRIYRMYLAKTSRDQYWEYKEEIKGVPTFAFNTKLTTTKEKGKRGNVTYHVIHFTKTGETEIKKYIAFRKKLDEDLAVFDKVREGTKGEADENTVKGKDPQQIIIDKYKLELGENFQLPTCPTCQSETVLRDSFKGPFFGCSTFPDCKGIVKLEDVMKDKAEEKIPTINVDDEATEKSASPVTEPTKEAEAGDEEDIKVENIPF